MSALAPIPTSPQARHNGAVDVDLEHDVPVRFANWWKQCNGGNGDPYAARVAWRAVNLAASEIDARTRAMLVLSPGTNDPYGHALLRLMKWFHGVDE